MALEGPLIPPQLPSWVKALKNAKSPPDDAETEPESDSDEDADEKARSRPKMGTVLPTMGSIMGIASDETRALMLRRFANFRWTFVTQMLAPGGKPVLLLSQQWRGILTVPKMRIDRSPIVKDNRGERKKTGRILAQVVDGLNIDESFLDPPTVSWNDHVLSPTLLPPLPVIRDILYYVNEVNFRTAILGLDNACSRDEPIDVATIPQMRRQMARCFPGDVDDPEIFTKPENDGRGIGDRVVKNRLPYLKALQMVMYQWYIEGWEQPDEFDGDEDDEDEILEFEQKLADYFCKAWFKKFQNAPPIPYMSLEEHYK